MSIFKAVAKRITPYMRANGFILVGRSYYYIVNDIAHCISFDAPGGFLYVTAYIMPLFIPCDSKYYTYGNRLNVIDGVNLPLLSKSEDGVAIDKWCSQLRQHIERKILPFFKCVDSPQKLVDYVNLSQNVPAGYLSCHKVYIWRLKMYTYLYMGKYSDVEHTIAHYRGVLNDVAFLTPIVLKKYIDEADMITLMIQGKQDNVTELCTEIISHTKVLLQTPR